MRVLKTLLSSIKLIHLIIVACTALCSIVVWAYSTFESKAVSEIILERLITMDKKIDDINAYLRDHR